MAWIFKAPGELLLKEFSILGQEVMLVNSRISGDDCPAAKSHKLSPAS